LVRTHGTLGLWPFLQSDIIAQIFWGEKQADGSYMPGLIEEALPVTLGINLLALLLVLLVAIPLGIFAALHQGKNVTTPLLARPWPFMPCPVSG